MITPVFRISQDSQVLVFVIRAPYARLSDAEVLIHGSEFKFFASPYFLRLKLPGQLSSAEEQVSYDCETGDFSVTVRKEEQGQDFEGLDMITCLLSVPKQRARQPLIQELDADECHDGDDGAEGDEEIDWCLEQVVPPDEDSAQSSLLSGQKYGFANQKANIFQRLDEEVALAIDLKDPDTKSRGDRRRERLDDECRRFDDDSYLFSLHEDQDVISSLIQKKNLHRQPIELDDQDLYDMKNLPIRSYLLDEREKKSLLFGLVDILFAYAYDLRTCDGEHSAESNWTISKLSASLSWLDTFHNMTDVVHACYRRALIFPLFRHHDVSIAVMTDVVNILSHGRKRCLKCLLDIRRVFNQTPDSKYILNDLFISDYCVWIQRVRDKTLQKVAAVLTATMETVSKRDLDLDLELLERAARLAIQEQEAGVHNA